MKARVESARLGLARWLVRLSKWVKPVKPAAQSDARTIEELHAEWEKDYLDSFRHQVLDMSHRRQVHDEFMALLRKAGDDSGIFAEAFHGMYLESQLMAIRRQTDPDTKVLSLRRFIGQLNQHRQALTREWYVNRWVGDLDVNSPDMHDRHMAEFHVEQAHAAFDRFADPHPKKRDVLSAKLLQADLDELDRMTKHVVRFVNSQVAHIERPGEPVSVTYGDFHAALDHLSEMLRKYYLLIDQGGLMSTTPTIQDDWLAPFRKPLAES